MPSFPEFSRQSEPIPLPQPGQHILAWAMQNPTAINRLIEMHNQMQNLEIAVVQNGVTTRAPIRIAPGAGNAVIEVVLPAQDF